MQPFYTDNTRWVRAASLGYGQIAERTYRIFTGVS